MKLSAHIQTAANIGIVVVCLYLVASAAGWIPFRPQSSAERVELATGEKFTIPDVDWRTHPSTVVIVFRRDCGYCIDGIPFYKRLTQIAKDANVAVVALLPEPVGDGRAYLATEDIHVDAARPTVYARPSVRRTPMVLLVDRLGVIRELWAGEIAESSHADVLETVKMAGLK